MAHSIDAGHSDHPFMNDRFPALRIILYATFSWCAGAIFAVVWGWLFFGFQLTRLQAQAVIAIFGVLGFLFGSVQALKAARTARAARLAEAATLESRD